MPPDPTTPVPAEVAARFGLSLAQVEECLAIQARGAAAFDVALPADRAAGLDALKGRPLAEILVEGGHLTPDRLAGLAASETLPPERPPSTRPGEPRTLAPPAPPRASEAAAPPAEAAPVLPSAAPAAPAATPGPSGVPPAPSPAFGRYEVVRELGRGGAGVVYLAIDRELRREVALKLLLPGAGTSADTIDRFLREARAAARLAHPHIARVYDVGIADGRHFITMEFVTGGSLADRLATRGRPRVPEAAALLHEIATGVACAHAQGIVHRDLKPGNVLLDDTGRPKITDFGIARVVEDDGQLRTQTGVVMGTPAYMAPEQAEGASEQIGPASDVYALGTILYEMVTGELPYRAESPLGLLLRKLCSDPRPPRARVPSLARDVDTIVQKAMERDPRRRYATAKELAEDLGRYLSGETILARPASAAVRAGKWVRRHPGLTGGLAAACLALAAGGGIAWRAGERSRAASAEQAAAEQRALAARERQAQLEQEVLAGVRRIASMSVDATLMVRRAGGRVSEAEERFLGPLETAARQAIERAPDLGEPHYHLGRMYRALMKFAEARTEQDRALAKDPNLAPSRYERSVLLAIRYGQRMNELRSEWRAREGQRLAEIGALERGGMGGERMHAQPAEEELARADEEARGLRETLTADLTRLEGAPADSLAPGRRDCARGFWLLYAGPLDRRVEAREAFARAIAADAKLEEAYEAWAALERVAGRPEQAIEIYGRGIAVDPGYVLHRLARGDVRAVLGHAQDGRGIDPTALFQAAIDDYSRALEIEPGFVSAWINRGDLRTNLGIQAAEAGADAEPYYRDAIADFTVALEREPGSALAWMRLGSARSNWAVHRADRGEDPRPLQDQAVADFEKALESDPARAEAWIRLGLLRTNRGAYEQGRGTDPSPWYRRAVEDLDRALMLEPGSNDALCRRGAARGNWGNDRRARGEDPAPWYRDAVADFTRALEIDPVSAPAWMRRGHVRTNWAHDTRSRGGDPVPLFRDAESDLGSALELDPRDAETWRCRGCLRTNWGEHDESRGGDPVPRYRAAVADFDRALEINPRSADTWILRGGVRTSWAVRAIRRGEDPEPLFRGAEADFAQALELNRAAPEPWLRRGTLRSNWGLHLQSRGRDPGSLHADAVADFDAAIERAPASADAWQSRGDGRVNWALWKLSRGEDPEPLYRDAAADFGRALELNPRDADLWQSRALVRTNWGSLLFGRGEDPGPRYGEAQADFDEALKRNPAFAEAWQHRGDLRSNWGFSTQERGADPEPHYAGAVADHGRALELNPGSAEAWMSRGLVRTNWGAWQQRRGGDPRSLYAEAETDFGRALELQPQYAEALKRRALVRMNSGLYRSQRGETVGTLFDDALADYGQAAQANPADPEPRWRRGLLLHALGRWSEALADFEAARALDPVAEKFFQAEHADARARAGSAGPGAAPDWVTALSRGAAAVQAGDYRRAREEYEAGLAAGAADSDRARLESVPEIRQALAHAHYNLACILSLHSAGKAGPSAPPEPMEAEAAARSRERAFVHLQTAVEFGWADAAHLRDDPDLAPLHGDARWAALLELLVGRGR